MKKIFLVLLLSVLSGAGFAQSINLPTPAGSVAFGSSVTVLPNGNYVVTDPRWSNGVDTNVGAVYLYNGQTDTLISTLTGSQVRDSVGSDGISILTNGNYVVRSPNWKNGNNAAAGAVTFGSGTTGISGMVSSANSLVGTLTGDRVGYYYGGYNDIVLLGNGNYVVRSPFWDNGTNANAGAVTFGNGITGISGALSSANSLVGTQAEDKVGYELGGSGGIVVLSNNNYVVRSPSWKNGNYANAGAITFGSGTAGVSGAVSSANSLVDVGYSDITVLSNSNYVVCSPNRKNGSILGTGAVTFGSGTIGISGAVSSTNSLVGTQANDKVGFSGIVALDNGNYVVRSSNWKNGTNAVAGAVTFGNGTTGISGAVSSANSLVGTQTNDGVGSWGVTALNTGSYVVRSPYWDNSNIANVGAVTFGNGTTGISGAVSSTNSLVGTQAEDKVGSIITVLGNGNYVVCSPNWKNGTNANAGAFTFGSGTTGISGAVSSANSLVGTQANDFSDADIIILSNGNYVVRTPFWDNGSLYDAGAVTFGNSTSGISGVVSSANSLVGTNIYDMVSYDFGASNCITILNNGNYVVRSPNWKNGSNSGAGAVTFGNGTTGISGAVSSANSLVGTQVGDYIGRGGTTALSNGNYVVHSPSWDNGSNYNAGAVTFGNGITGIFGAVDSTNSLVGTQAGDGVGNGVVTPLSNGNYVVCSPNWKNGTNANTGAVTFGNGTTGISGAVSSANSLVGTQAEDKVGSSVITVLGNGNYVVCSPNWKNGTNANAGAVTFGNGTTGISGAVSSANSLVGTQVNDNIGSNDISVICNMNYVVRSPFWDNGNSMDAGMVTFGNGTTGISGAVSSANSLVGTQTGDNIGSTAITVLSNDNYIINSFYWRDVNNAYTRAITLGNGVIGTNGFITTCNSVIGNISTGRTKIFYLSVAYNDTYEKLLVGNPKENIVTVFAPSQSGIATTSTATSNRTNNNTLVSFVDTTCALIASLKPTMPAPLVGKVKATVYIQPSTPMLLTGEVYTRRYYSLLPADSADFKTAKVTLYFTQAEFNDYNNTPGITSKLPAGPTDAAGKAALRITQQKGTSATGAFGSFTGFAGSGPANVLVIPGDSNVVWNAPLSRWEVSFPVTGFGGFFLSAGNNNPLSGPAEIQKANDITVSPIPASSTLTITNSNAALAGSTITALNLQGQVMATATLETFTKLDVQNWPAGIYLLRFEDGSVVKVVKQ